MQTQSITVDHIREAILSLRGQGIDEPQTGYGIQRLRNRLRDLGYPASSTTRVSQLKREFYRLEQEGAHENARPLPEPVKFLVEQLWCGMCDAADTQEAEIIEQADTRIHAVTKDSRNSARR